MNIKSILLLSFVTLFQTASAQDDLLNMLDTKPSSEPVFATFKTTKIINANTIELMKKGNLDFRVAHRFGNFGGGDNATNDFQKYVDYKNVVGIDNSTDIRIAFEYGVTDKFNVGFARYKQDATYEGLAKYRLFTQTEDNKYPVSLLLFATTVVLLF